MKLLGVIFDENTTLNRTLNFFGQTNDTGKLICGSYKTWNPAIGDVFGTNGTINIHGGNLKAEGGRYSPAIGMAELYVREEKTGIYGSLASINIFGGIIDAIVEDFSKCGYDVYYQLLNARDYEVPEDRERVIIVGFRKDLGIKEFEYPVPRGFRITMREALKNIPDPTPDEVCTAPYSSRYMSRNRKRNWDDVSYTIPAMAKQVPLWPGSPVLSFPYVFSFFVLFLRDASPHD
jgi:hypothetical protein